MADQQPGSFLDAIKAKAALGGGSPPASTAPAGAPPPVQPVGAPPPAGAPNNTGTTTGPSVLGPTIGGAVGGLPVVGGIVNDLTSPTQVDTSLLNNQVAASNALSTGLGTERANMGPPTLDTTQANQTRDQQMQSIAALTGAANGTIPSAADLSAEKTRQANVANQIGMAAAARGHSAGGTGYNAAENTANINSAAAGDAAIRRATEQSAARQQLVTALGGQRSQDIDQAAKAAGLSNDQYLALLQGQIQALNGGTNAASAAATASAANAASQNKMKGGLISGAADLIGA